jgi:FMN phosphatase YigB (HAD superfamily)
VTRSGRASADWCFRAVLFDFDHTLFRFDDSTEWLRVAFDRCGRGEDPVEFRALYDRIEDARLAVAAVP